MYTLNNFYTSKEWRALLATIKHERLNEEGLTICEYCGRPIVRAYDCIGHHKEELTEENVNNIDVSLNSDNIQLVHHKCHNIIHNKLGYKTRGVWLVYGAPLAGKSAWVREVAEAGDLIVNINDIWQMVSGCDRYVKPNRLKGVVFGVRDYLLECIKYRRGRWNNAYIIGGYALASERDRLCKTLGAKEVYIECEKNECIARLIKLDDVRRTEQTKEYMQYIEEWFATYTPPI